MRFQDEEVWVYDHQVPLDLRSTHPSAVELISAAHARAMSQGKSQFNPGLSLETEAAFMTPNGVDFSFFFSFTV